MQLQPESIARRVAATVVGKRDAGNRGVLVWAVEPVQALS